MSCTCIVDPHVAALPGPPDFPACPVGEIPDCTCGIDIYDDQSGTVSNTLGGTITDSGTSMTIADLDHFPSDGCFFIQIGSEKILVTGGAGTTSWTIQRGVLETTPAAHTSGATVTWILPDYVPSVTVLRFTGRAFVQPISVSPYEAEHIEVTQPVEVVDGEADSNGLQPGFVLEYDRDSHSMSQLRTCKIFNPNA